MSEEKGEIKVKLKRGAWEIEITCPEDKLKQAIESVLEGLSSSQAQLPQEEVRRPRATMTCRAMIYKLWEEGWFKEERTLAEVHEELSRRGYNYDKTAVAHNLTDLVRENVLTRQGTPRAYRYVQKRPPTIDQ
jgi:hypothetical protein